MLGPHGVSLNLRITFPRLSSVDQMQRGSSPHVDISLVRVYYDLSPLYFDHILACSDNRLCNFSHSLDQ
jgi:hypothetical protein